MATFASTRGVSERDRRTSVALVIGGLLAAVLGGMAAGRSPELAVAAAGGIAVLALAFGAPVFHLLLTLTVAMIVPYDLQNRFGVSAGGSASVVLVDVLFLAAVAYAAVRWVNLLREGISARLAAGFLLLLAFFALATVQVFNGVMLGFDPSTAGYELRQMFGLGLFFAAVPLLLDDDQRPKLLRGLVVVGLLLGVWGIAQWVLSIPPNISEDIGVRQGVAQTTSGLGQILGGRYGFPSAVVLAFAALIAGRARSPSATAALVAVLLLNGVSLVLTYERAFWLAAALAVGIVVVRAGHVQRIRAIVWGCLGLVLASVAFSVVAPGQATAVRERFLSLGQAETDTSVTYRLIETRHVVDRIREREITGSGLGATITWGRPSEGVPASTESYSHNAYLRTAWKMGIPGALLLLAILAVALLGRRAADEESAVLHTGARAALLALMIMAVTGPVFDTLNASAGIGLVLALCVALPSVAGRTRAATEAE